MGIKEKDVRHLPGDERPPGWSARAAFEEGRHREVVRFVAPPGGDGEESMALIGSLSFLGRVEEAADLWRICRDRLSGPERARARFALALAWLRIPRFREARRYLRESLADPGCQGLADVSQGLGVYHYYLGRFPLALKYARRARRRALRAGDTYLHAFSSDLLGHTLVQTGRRAAGIRLLEQARALAARGDGADPFTPERLISEAEAGLRPATILSELWAEYGKISETSYTKADLALEIARQLTLRGSWSQARELLDAEAPAIYGFGNRRQEATLQLRLAELGFQRGDAPGAIHFLRAARRCLLRMADKNYEIRILGLEHKVQRRLLGVEPAAESLARLRELAETHGSPMHRRIQARLEERVEEPELPGEDPLGDFLDSLARAPGKAADAVLRTEYLGLWPGREGLDLGTPSLTLFSSGHWVAADSSGVWRSQSPLSSQGRALLRRLGRGPATKADLAQAVWRYDYHPLRHDSMIYAALAALRKSLGSAGKWLETRDNSWVFHGLRLPAGEGEGLVAHHVSPKSKVSNAIAPWSSSLNWRQIQALSDVPEGGAWNIGAYREKFGVSTMTAWRDLDALVKKRYLERVGHGRATAYLLGARDDE